MQAIHVEQQRADALKVANTVRSEMRELKQSLGGMGTVDSRRRASSLLLNPPASVRSMRVRCFLRALPKVGSVGTRGLLKSIGCTDGELMIGPRPNRPVEALTKRQRELLASLLVSPGFRGAA